MPPLARNKKAFHNYHILDKIEAGIALQGTEVKSCRAHDVSLTEAHARIKNGELWLVGCHIAPYKQGNRANHVPRRDRKLLLHKREIRRLQQAIEAKGMTLVPLALYLKRSKIKVELALCRGKADHDKREDMKRRLHQREAERAIAQRA